MAKDNYWQPIADILSRYPRFLKAVAKVRRELGVPEGGISMEQRASWYGSLIAAGEVDTGKRYGYISGHDLLPSNKKILDALDQLARDFNLDSRWLHSLFAYVFLGDKKLSPPFYRSASPQAYFNDVRLPKEQLRVTSLSISLQKDTSIEDIRAIWPEVEKLQAYMDSDIPQRRDKIKPETVRRYLKVRELEDKGLSQKDIAEKHQKLGFDTAKDVSDFKRELEQRFKPAKSGELQKLPPLWWHV
ncbi:MAG: hypothetical protein ACREGG_04020 [Candidatus Saccharimonadales bacterium]